MHLLSYIFIKIGLNTSDQVSKMTKWLNNFCENLVNSSNPSYCGEPVQRQTFMTLNQQETQQFAQLRMLEESFKADRDRRERLGLWVSESERMY